MKKLMALCLSLLMALSMVSFSVMAEETEAVTFADFANGQLQNFIVDDLLFPVGAEVTSSDESIIELDGTVNRPLLATANVTVTVNGASFALTVQPQTVVGVSELVDFDGYGLEAGTALTQDLGWKLGTDSKGKFAAVIGQEDDGNQYGKLSFTSTSGNDSSYSTNAITYTFQNAPGIQNARYYYLNAKVHVPAKAASHSALNMNLSWGGVKAGEFMLGSAGNTGYIYGGALLTGNPWHTRATAKNSCYKVPTSDFVELVIKVDKETGIVNYYQNGRWTETVTYDASKTYVPDYTQDKTVTVVFPWRTSTSEIWVDDIYVYAEATADGFMGTLPAADRVAYFKSQILSNSITKSSSLVGVDQNLNLYSIPAAANTTITWESSNTNLITNDGVVTLVNSNAPQDVTFTGTITAGDVTDTVVFNLQVAQAGTTSLSRADLENKTGAAYETEAGRGVVQHLRSVNTGSTTKSEAVASGGNWFDRVLVSADVKYAHNRELTSNYGGLLVNGIQGAEACSVYLNYKSKLIGLLTSKSYPNGTGSKISFSSVEAVWFPMPEALWDKEGEWVQVVIDFNVLSQTYDAYVNGIKINETPVVRANAYKTNTSGATVRGVLAACSAAGDVWLDNVTIRKYGTDDDTEVHAALSAAAVNVAGSNVQPVIVNGADLPAKTISKSWKTYNETTREYAFLNDASDRINNPGEYTYQEDGPSITYAINGTPVTEINVTSPQVVDFTITATKGDITESVTLKKMVAPVGVRGFALGTLECINGVWLTGEFDGDEKLVAAVYTRNKLTSAKIMPISADNAKYNPELNMMTEVSITNPKYSNPTQIKFFILDGDCITPLSVVNEDIHD